MSSDGSMPTMVGADPTYVTVHAYRAGGSGLLGYAAAQPAVAATSVSTNAATMMATRA